MHLQCASSSHWCQRHWMGGHWGSRRGNNSHNAHTGREPACTSYHSIQKEKHTYILKTTCQGGTARCASWASVQAALTLVLFCIRAGPVPTCHSRPAAGTAAPADSLEEAGALEEQPTCWHAAAGANAAGAGVLTPAGAAPFAAGAATRGLAAGSCCCGGWCAAPGVSSSAC
jgi:hypothetical protein